MYEQIAANKRKTVFLVFLFVLLLSAVGVAVDFFLRGGVVGFVIVAVIVAVASFVSYFNSDKVALRMAHAVPADPVEYARYHNLVEGLCIASGLPKPRLYIVDDDAPNAFSTGRNPKHAAVAVTTGLLAKMNRVELEGVLAHELSHIRNYDVLVMTLAVTMVGIIALISDFFLRMMFWTGGRGGRDDRNGNNPLGIVFAILGFVLLIFAPIIATLMQFAVSRNREYLADASGVQLTRYPPGLISALEKLKDDHTSTHFASKATAHLWIEEPLDKETNKGDTKWNHLFDTHPPIDDRIHALEQM
ncbi:MAG TPA: zinc metalloprotease HtpX [Acidimicrobiia bacterium]|nr:zinc metalloprotease HtpX [Acidimicrobiia bacterium]